MRRIRCAPPPILTERRQRMDIARRTMDARRTVETGRLVRLRVECKLWSHVQSSICTCGWLKKTFTSLTHCGDLWRLTEWQLATCLSSGAGGATFLLKLHPSNQPKLLRQNFCTLGRSKQPSKLAQLFERLWIDTSWKISVPGTDPASEYSQTCGLHQTRVRPP